MTPNFSRKALWYGVERDPQAAVALRAGPLALTFCEGVFRYIKLGEREVLRAVYFAVRDESWNTIAGTISNLAIRSNAESFSVSYDCAHRERGIDFRWKADITGCSDGSIVWKMEGQAFSGFLKNRIGICVLHPIAECAGKPCLIVHSDGTKEETRFPEFVAPHQPFIDVREMRFAAAPNVEAELAFAGDVFETEDQRNWTDASFKTYSTPLSLAYPVRIEKGTAVSQSVTLKLRGDSLESPVLEPAQSSVQLSLQLQSRTPLPRIGLKDAVGSGALSDAEIRRLKPLHLDHLGVDLDVGNRNSEESFWKSAAKAQMLGLPLEVALAPVAEDAELPRILQQIESQKIEICRWLADVQMQAPSRSRALQNLLAVAPVAFGRGANFAELNRNRPLAAPAGGTWFSLNPQMHAFDDTTLIENLAAQSSALDSLRTWMDGTPIAVSPVTLRARAECRSLEDPSRQCELIPPDADPRQTSLFGAGWILGSLKHLAEGGAASITCYETSGARGVMSLQVDSQTLPGYVYPMYQVFLDIAEFKNAEVVRVVSSDPLRGDGVAFIEADRLRILVANFTADTVGVALRLGELAGRVRVNLLDDGNGEFAMFHPELFRQRSGHFVDAHEGEMRIELGPYALATLDAPLAAGAGSPLGRGKQ
jgi:hypothetical protein